MTDAKLKSELLNMDLYKLLECQETCTPEELKRAYRKRALDLHPDKNPHKKEEAERAFIQLGKAFEILADKSARAAYDAARKAKRKKALRDSQMDAKRRKMKEELENREKAARDKAEQKEERLVFVAKFYFKEELIFNPFRYRARQERTEQAFYDEIERVSRENRRFLEEENNRIMEQIRLEKMKRAAEQQQKSQQQQQPSKLSQSVRIKLTWPPNESSRLNQEFIESLFSKYGRIEHLILGTKAKKPSAILEYATTTDATNCMSDEAILKDEYSIQIQCLDNLNSDRKEEFTTADTKPDVEAVVVDSEAPIEGESFEDLEARILKKMRSTNK